MTNPRLAALAAQGVSIWLDDLSRERITSGNLAALIADDSVTGVTTNPSIFQAAISHGDAYAAQVRSLAQGGADVDHAVFLMTTQDVRDACDIFAGVAHDTDGVDGRVSIEVDPRLAHDSEATIVQAQALHAAVGRDNVLIKIPATLEGLPAITAAIAEGISVNVTLIFSIERYRAVVNAYLAGLEAARARGLDLSRIHSVASLFVSRVDTEIDARLTRIEGPEAERAASLKGRAGVANARLVYQAYEEIFSSARWESLAAAGGRPQRPLWASTGVKDPAFPDTLYVTQLVAPGTVNTMPEKTLHAVADHGEIDGDTITDHYAQAQAVLDDLEQLGVSYRDVTDLLEREGVQKFEKSWNELLDGVTTALEGARA